LHDLMEVVIEYGERRWSGGGTKSQEAALGSRTAFGIIVGAWSSIQCGIVAFMGIGPRQETQSGRPLHACRRHGGNAAIGRIDNDGRSLLSVHHVDLPTRIDPERVVTANIAGGNAVSNGNVLNAITLGRLRPVR